MNVFTLTLNPAFDVHAGAQKLALYRENIVALTGRDAGGKGLNISRALAALGVTGTNVVILGAENAEEFLNCLGEGLRVEYITVPGRIRENLTVHDEDGKETRISFPGFSVGAAVLQEVSCRLSAACPGDIVTLTGSLPQGMDKRAMLDLLCGLRERGVLVVLDSRSFAAEDIEALRPWLIKPNEEEIRTYMNASEPDLAQMREWALGMNKAGVCNIIISLGAGGAYLVRDGETYFADAPAIKPVSTIGAGDSLIAGFIAAYAAGEGAEDLLRSGVAAGSAACLTPGTAAPERAVYLSLRERVAVVSVK